MKFLYASGEKPLEGYVIKRGIGRGGFGEVYFGVSDRGKEVALKLIQANLDIELRGIQQCLNLKHPNLVHLYDIRTDVHGDHWLIMEHVAGEPLSAILARNPHGVSPELAGQWFLGLAAAVHCLHDHGIVHRDLKPGNVFLENGFIKVGDYGLCKSMGGSQNQKQTQSVGTVHYMAPEMASGNYKHQVDIYAAGIILYELLTGHVPFDGESAVEIMFKHQAERPDLSKVPADFAPILDRALCKNPAQRFQSLSDMSKQVEAVIEHRSAPAAELNNSVPALPARPRFEPPTLLYRKPLERLAGAGGTLLTALCVAAVGTFALSVFAKLIHMARDPQDFVAVFALTALSCAAILIPAQFWTAQAEESWPRRFLFMGLGIFIGLTALWFDGYELPIGAGAATADSLRPYSGPEQRDRLFGSLYAENRTLPILLCYGGYFGLMFLALRWWKLSEPMRPARFRVKAVIAAAFWAYLLLFLLPASPQRREAFLAFVLTSVVVQLVSPWQPRGQERGKRLRLRSA